MPSTRRRVLRSAVCLLGALAGCNGESSSEPTATPTANAPPSDGPPSDALSDPPRLTLRKPDSGLVVTRGDAESTDDHRDRFFVVAEAETAASLSFAPVDGVADARQFVADTDFESESVYVDQRPVPECYRRRLCWIRWTEVEVETSYARTLRDADVACEADAEDVVATFVRLPAVLSGVSRFHSSSGGGPCRPAEGRA
jgi:hypothetical protein